MNLLVSLETLALSFPAAQDTKGRPCQEAEDLRHPSCKEHVNSNVESDAGRNGDRRHLMMRRREREREREREGGGADDDDDDDDDEGHHGER